MPVISLINVSIIIYYPATPNNTSIFALYTDKSDYLLQATHSFIPSSFLFILYIERNTPIIPYTSFISFITNREIGYITRYHLLLQTTHSFIHSSLLSILFVERNTPTIPLYHTHQVYPLLLTGKSVT